MSELTTRAISPVILYIGRDGNMVCIPSAAKELRARKSEKWQQNM
jgi:hypothetical protein